MKKTLLLIVMCSRLFATDVVTHHNDNARTGQNTSETILTTSNVNSSTFGKLRTISVDGRVDAQPLYLAKVSMSGGNHNVLYVATTHDSVYAFDADSGSQLWKVTVVGAGETPSNNEGCDNVMPEIGIISTPVIDRRAGRHGIIYLVAASKGIGENNRMAYHHRLHALDVTTGEEALGGPTEIVATFPGTGDGKLGDNVVFDSKYYFDRAALLLANGNIYTSWSSLCDYRPYTGWVISYNATTLVRNHVLNITPNGDSGAIWMSGNGPAADRFGNVYLLDGNGTFDSTLSGGFPVNSDYGNAFLKFSSTLHVKDYFQVRDVVFANTHDIDLGSGSVLILPDLVDSGHHTKHLAVGAGKDGHIYVVDRDNMGKFNSESNNIWQDITSGLGSSVFSGSAYFNGKVYFGPREGTIKAFNITNALLATSASFQTNNTFAYPGATPSISANGTRNAILWAAEDPSPEFLGGCQPLCRSGASPPAVLHAYDASNLHELYNSNQASNGRDHFGMGNKFITPTVAGGKVFVGTTSGVGVFGLLH
jgi:outer membrane protein assembly factor BamB